MHPDLPAVRIVPSARRHGVGDDDITHAYRNPWAMRYVDDAVHLLVGPGRDSRMLELMFEYDRHRHEHRIFHAMAARPRYLRMLR